MSLVFYVGDAGPVPATITDELGDPITPLSATATVVNVHTGQVVALNEACVVGPGVASWPMPAGHTASLNSARYVAYITVDIAAGERITAAIPFDVLDKASYFAVDRWRRKVEHSAPDEDAISDEEARDWIDQAVDHLAGHYGFAYGSTLASLTPAADRPTVEFVASVAALMARTAWWAGKGNWRDEEMSLDTSPFWQEWDALKPSLQSTLTSGWFTGHDDPNEVNSMYNRDKVDSNGFADIPDDYYDAAWLGDE